MTDSSVRWSGGSVPSFSAQLSDVDGVMVLRLVGELDLAAAATLDEISSAACAATVGALVVDVAQLRFIDAGGLRLLLGLDERLRGEGRPGVAVQGAAGIVRRVFEITQLTSVLDDRTATALQRSSPPTATANGCELDAARRDAELSVIALFVTYFALGGTADLAQFCAHLDGTTDALDVHQQDVAVHAINEWLDDLGRTDRLLPYASDRG